MPNVTYHGEINGFSYRDIYAIPFERLVVTTASESRLAGYFDGFYLSIEGILHYDDFGVRDGLITSISVTYESSPVISITGLLLDATQLGVLTPLELESRILVASDVFESYSDIGGVYNLYYGDDWVRLGNGDDTVNGGPGIDTLHLDVTFDSARLKPLPDYGLEITSAQGRDTVFSVPVLEFLDGSVHLMVGNRASLEFLGDAIETVPNDLFFAGKGNDTLIGLTGDDMLYGQAGNDALFGGLDRDLMFGGGGNDSLDGGSGRDRVKGGEGNDLLEGGRHNDVLIGDAGRDILVGGTGNDFLTGGAGRDIFRFARAQGSDRIADFQLGLDRIEIGKGAGSLADLTFQRQGGDVLVSFAGTDILVENMRVPDLKDDANFLF